MTHRARSTAAAAVPHHRISGCASRRQLACSTSPRGLDSVPILFESLRWLHQFAIETDESARRENVPEEASDQSPMLFACTPTRPAGTLAGTACERSEDNFPPIQAASRTSWQTPVAHADNLWSGCNTGRECKPHPHSPVETTPELFQAAESHLRAGPLNNRRDPEVGSLRCP